MDAGRQIRVLWCIKCLGFGGAERLLVSAALARDTHGFAYEAAYVLPSRNALVPELEAAGVPVTCLGPSDTNIDLRWMSALRRLLVRRRFDVVHFHLPYTAGLGRAVVRSLTPGRRPAVVTTEHNVWSTNPWPIRLVNRLTLPLDSARLAVSDAVRDALPRRYRTATEVVTHGVPAFTPGQREAWRHESRAELGVGPHEVLIGTVANLRPGKGYEVLLPTARDLLDRGLPVRFAAIGEGPLEAEVTALHAQLALGGSFELLGGRPDALRLLAGFDIFVLPSTSEGRPVSVMEALSLGIPVVATAVGGTTEMVRHGVDGLLVAPSSPDHLAGAIASLVADRRRRARMAVAARGSGARFDVATAVHRAESIYRRLAVRKGPDPATPLPRRLAMAGPGSDPISS